VEINWSAAEGIKRYREEPAAFNNWCASVIGKLGSCINDPIVSVQAIMGLTKNL
jgi:hypothetical protein